jgi:outer membrane receptor protein involved in Fe transport
MLTDVRGDGNVNLINIAPASNPTAYVTQNGYFGYGATFIGNFRRSLYDVDYGVNAPYASFNYHVGKISIGGSLRYDYGTARGSIYSADLNALDGGTRVGVVQKDMNGDGVISSAETRVQVLPLTQGAPINYNYHYVSYSTGVNYRVSEPFAVFARYSRGARANADRILFSDYISPTTGALTRPDAAYDPVTQAEAGLKYRKSGLTLNVTGFWAKTKEHNIGLERSYRAYGAEFEGGFHKGPWSITAGATYTNAEITSDAVVSTNVGNTPKQQPDLIFQTTPQFNSDRFSIGAVVIGTTGSYVTDTNQLKMPGFTTVNPFVQFRPVERVQLSLNCNNLFNVLGLVDVDQATIPASGIVTARAINGRTVSTSLRFNF